ncbi:hypothetical protein C0995_007661 [Termitomyces sp. Mi166|nr:hypothetical protein C0995_007661 [Termitomyces sp. Mi166\
MPVMITSRPPVSTASSSSKTIKTAAQGRATYPTLAVHRGAIDQTMITTGPPPGAMKRILSVLETMGIVVEAEHEYRYRCTRPKRHTDLEDATTALILGNGHSKGTMSTKRPPEASKTPNPPHDPDLDLEEDFGKSFTTDLSSGPVDEPKEPPITLSRSIVAPPDLILTSTQSVHPSVPTELPPEPTTPNLHIHTPFALVPSSSLTQPLSQPGPIPQDKHISSGPILIPRKPSHLLANPTSLSSSLDSDVGLLHAPPNQKSVVYGPRSEDPGEEVRFTAELTRLENLDTTYSLDIRRLKGNLRSYKFLYDTLRERADLQAVTA